MANFFAELKRRHIYRVGAAYAVVAWLVLQLANNVAPILDLPVWVARTVLLLLVLGFPIALLLAWVVEGERVASKHKGAKTVAPARSGAVDWVVAGALTVVIALMLYQQIASSPAVGTANVRQAGIVAARQAAVDPHSAISLAVLPFVNLSSDKEQEFFSDGMTEEITAALAKVPDLRVIARTSAFEFKGKNVNIKSMGEQLGATHLIEGSVRKAGNRLRITAQLIKADDGTHIWAEDYDRDLNDIFAVQEDIARAITASLRMPLGLKPGENLVNNRNIDKETYEKYLRARALYQSRGGGLPNVAQATALLEEIVGKYPDYAPALATLGRTYYIAGNSAATRAQANELRTKAEAATQRAVRLDPNLSQAYVDLAVLAWSHGGKALEADELVAKSVALDSTGQLIAMGTWLSMAGKVKEALPLVEEALAIEPFVPTTSNLVANVRWLNGQNDAAIALAKTLRPIDRAPILAKIYASMGRYEEAATALMEIASDPDSAAAQAARLLRTAPRKAESPQELPRLPANLEFVYLYIGAPDRAIGVYERGAENGYFSILPLCCFWHPSYAAVRKTEQFKALMRKTGLVDYWRAKGWPQLCRPTTGDDFTCE